MFKCKNSKGELQGDFNCNTCDNPECSLAKLSELTVAEKRRYEMIYIKTEMKGKPYGCETCAFSHDTNGIYGICTAKIQRIDVMDYKRRPDWCPLVEIKEETK